MAATADKVGEGEVPGLGWGMWVVAGRAAPFGDSEVRCAAYSLAGETRSRFDLTLI